MVYYELTKRERVSRKDKPSDSSGCMLPNELLVQVAGHLPTNDILSFRLASRALAGDGATAIKTRLTRLYIHPSGPSLRTAVDICNSELGSAVEKVCLLGKILWQQNLESHRDFRHAEASSIYLRDNVFDTFRPWPHAFPKPKTNHEKDEHRHDTFDAAYQPLVDALARLPKLTKIAFAETINGDGFNKISQAKIDAHAQKYVSMKKPSITTKAGRHSWSDADAVLDLLSASRLTFSGLSLMADLPFITRLSREMTADSDDQPVKSRYSEAIGRLETLELHLDCGWNDTEWHRFCSVLLSKTLGLKRLRVVFKHNAAVRRFEVMTCLTNILGLTTLRELQSLELIAQLPGPVDGRSYRPITLRFDLPGFLARHAALQILRLSNVLLAKTFADRGVVMTLRTTLDSVQAADSNVRNFAWRISRYTSDPRCKRADGGSLIHDCKFYCGIYCSMEVGMVTSFGLDTFAEEVGAELVDSH